LKWEGKGKIETLPLFDETQDNYAVTNVAWIAWGAFISDIVLGFYRPERRTITDFAVA